MTATSSKVASDVSMMNFSSPPTVLEVLVHDRPLPRGREPYAQWDIVAAQRFDQRRDDDLGFHKLRVLSDDGLPAPVLWQYEVVIRAELVNHLLPPVDGLAWCLVQLRIPRGDSYG